MSRGSQQGLPPSKREQRVQHLGQRMMRGTEVSPEEELQQSQDVLAWAQRNKSADSSFSIKAMIDVADQLSRQDRAADEVALREQIVTALRTSFGPDDESTLTAELRLATCLIRLGHLEEAEHLLAHVVDGRVLAHGRDDPDTLVAMAWRAHVSKKLGHLDHARVLQQEILARYESIGRGESPEALLAALNLATTLTELHEKEEAARLLRHVLTVRRRVLGPDDPKTLEVQELLASLSGRTA
jgi:predicted negative regulator of RcsB-dependent stress response